MPEVTAIIDKVLLQDRAYEISKTRVESVRGALRGITASTMSSLDWENKKPLVLEPLSQVTPVIMLAGDIANGDPVEIATPDVAAIVHIWAFDYPSRNGAVSRSDVLGFTLEDQETIDRYGLLRPMEERLEMFRDRLKKVLGTDRHIEVNFVPQRKGHWVGG